jgi:acetyl-CoA acetyltransferase
MEIILVSLPDIDLGDSPAMMKRGFGRGRRQMSLAERRARAAIVGVGATPYYRRGASFPQSVTDLAVQAITAAAEDAGISVHDIDGFSYHSGGGGGVGSEVDPALLMEAMGIPQIHFAAGITGGGGGSAGSVGLAAMAAETGTAKYVVALMAMQQRNVRFGQTFARVSPTSQNAFYRPAGLFAPGQFLAMLTRRHMHLYGTRREAFAEVAISTRTNAINRPSALMREPLTRDAYFNARMVADPLCLYDFCLEGDGAVAVIVSTDERARDLRARPVHILASQMGGSKDWGRGFLYGNMPDATYASSGYRSLAEPLFQKAGVRPADVDVALLYDHFSPLVIMQLEDMGFCPVGEGGAFVESGAIRFDGGQIPVNTHGGHLSEAYIIGMTHIREAVEQLRGVAINQVAGAEIALVTGGTAPLPLSALLLGRD